VDQITIHVTEGSEAATVSWFNSPQAEASAHFLVTIAGKIRQFVKVQDRAWHNGRVLNPTAPLVLARPGVNPNWWSVGIEHEGSGTQPLAPAQKAASAWLIGKLCRELNIPVNRDHIVGHHQVFAGKVCPGKIDVDELVKLVKADQASQIQPLPEKPYFVWSDFLKDWLLVTKVVSDTEWYFTTWKELQKLGPPERQRAQARLSEMKR